MVTKLHYTLAAVNNTKTKTVKTKKEIIETIKARHKDAMDSYKQCVRLKNESFIIGDDKKSEFWDKSSGDYIKRALELELLMDDLNIKY